VNDNLPGDAVATHWVWQRGGWLLVRVTIPLVLGNDLGFGGRAIVTNAMFATVFGLLGGALSMRDARV